MMAVVDTLEILLSAKGADKVAAALGKVGEKIDKAEQELTRLNQKYGENSKVSEKARVEQKRLISSLRREEMQLKKTAASADLASKGLRNLGNVGSTLGKLLGGGLLAGGVAGAGLAGLTVAFDEFTSAALETKTAAAAVGLSINELQRMEFAAERSGLQVSELRLGMRQLAARMNEVRDSTDGNDGVSIAFKNLGIEVDKFDMLSPRDQMLELADAANRMGNSAFRNANFARIFGEEAGAKFADLLGKGSAGIVQLGDDLERVGGLLDPETVIKADAMENQILLLKRSLGTLKGQILGDLLPVYTEVSNSVLEYIRVNRSLIRTKAQQFFEKLVAVGRKLIPLAERTFKAVAPLVDKFLEMDNDTILSFGKLALSMAAIGKTAGPISDVVSGLNGMVKAGLELGDNGAVAKSMQSFAAKMGPGMMSNPYVAIGAALIAATVAGLEFLNVQQRIQQKAAVKAAGSENQFLNERSVTQLSSGPNLAVNFDKETMQRVSREVDNRRAAAERKLVRRNGVTGSRRVQAEKDLQKAIVQQNILRKAREQQQRNADAKAEIDYEKENDRILQEAIRDQATADAKARQRAIARQKGGAGPGAAESKLLSDEELAKLIAEAARSGRNIDEMLGQDKIKGNSPPVLTVIIHNNSTNVTVGDFVVDGGGSADPVGIAKNAMESFRTMLGEELMQNSPKGERPVV